MIDNWEKEWKKYNDKICERIGWAGALLVIFGYYLNAHQHLSCWICWIIGNLCVAGYSMHKKAYSTVIMSLIITLMNVYGYVNWINP